MMTWARGCLVAVILLRLALARSWLKLAPPLPPPGSQQSKLASAWPVGWRALVVELGGIGVRVVTPPGGSRLCDSPAYTGAM